RGAERIDDPELLPLTEELPHRRLDAPVLLHPHPHEPGGTELLRALHERVEAPAPRLPLAGYADALDGFGLERTELRRRKHLAHVDELQTEADVWLVDAEAVHRLLPRHSPERGCPVAAHRLDGGLHRLRDNRPHVVAVGKAHLHVVLHELELAVGAPVP